MVGQEGVSLEFIQILSYWYTYGKNTGYLHPIACTQMSAKVNAKDFSAENVKLFAIIIPITYLLFCIGQNMNYDSPIGE